MKLLGSRNCLFLSKNVYFPEIISTKMYNHLFVNKQSKKQT